LLVEDNPGDAKLVDHHLSDPAVEQFVDGVSLTHVETLSAAESALATDHYGVVLLDLGLPTTSGLETLDRARSLADEQPIIVLTGMDDHETAMAAIERGAQDYLPKGDLDGDRLVRALRYAVVRHRQELAVERRRDQLEFFNSVLGHDILNGMNVVRGHADLLARGLDDDDDRRDHAETIQSWSDDMIDLTQTVRSILATITDESGRELRPVQLEPVLEDAAERARSMDPEASVSVSAAPGVAVQADDLLVDVLANVTTNAVEHGGDALSVDIEAVDDGGTVRVRVADDGAGIDDDRKETVFERDAKGGGSTGSGFGLYFVASMMDAYDGDVRVEDSDAGGAAFVVELRPA